MPDVQHAARGPRREKGDPQGAFLRCCLSGGYPGEPFWDALRRKG